MKIADLVCIGVVTGTYATISYASLCLHIRKMTEAIQSEVFPLKGVSRVEASAQLREWDAQRKRLLPMAILFAAFLFAVDYVLNFK
ncbi:hypothetical protein [Paraburkholderia sp. J67]|uniref:hypothetical protein n=1 Tax=Paraburkholderia sp. J67 TaxID=2805435 RepID=UPI002ABD9577|nr:hypothetical protein [Paraburkholderia sp. J67]